MTYRETIEYLYAQLPMFTRIGAAAYKEDLHNTIALCEALGNPHRSFRSIHVAGTNGKGSTSHMLAAVLQQAGYKTGLYTSPHIKDFGERIRINGEMIDQQFVIGFVERTKKISAAIQPSFFELTVAMAFDYFAAQQVDIAVIETGLGGRLDSTNIIKPVLSVITNIGYDHMNILGNTLPEIASQKAGIIKQDTPVVIGEYLPETKPVFEKEATEKNAPLFFASEQFETGKVEKNESMICHVNNKISHGSAAYALDLTGAYQAKNICTVLMSLEVLKRSGFDIGEDDIMNALKNVKGLTGLGGRWDIVQHDPTVIMDVGHNTDGINLIVQQLKNDYPASHYHFVLGFVKDKDVAHVMELFPKDASYYFTNAHIPRAMPFEELQTIGKAYGLQGKGFNNVNDALADAKNHAGPNDVIMICGSFFIVAEVND